MPIMAAVVCTVVASVVIPIMFSIFRAQFKMTDVVLAAVVAGLLSLVPTVGSVVSMLALVLILHWRCGASLFPDIVLSVAIARLAMVPALLPFAAGK